MNNRQVEEVAKALGKFFDGFDTQDYRCRVYVYFENNTEYPSGLFSDSAEAPRYVCVSTSHVLKDWSQWLRKAVEKDNKFLNLGEIVYVGIVLSHFDTLKPSRLVMFRIETYNPDKGFEFVVGPTAACAYTEGLKSASALHKHLKEAIDEQRTIVLQKDVLRFCQVYDEEM